MTTQSYSVLRANGGYYKLLQGTTGYYKLLVVTTVYWRLLEGLLGVTKVY